MIIIIKLVPSLTLEIIREMGLLKCIKTKFCMGILDQVLLSFPLYLKQKVFGAVNFF